MESHSALIPTLTTVIYESTGRYLSNYFSMMSTRSLGLGSFFRKAVSSPRICALPAPPFAVVCSIITSQCATRSSLETLSQRGAGCKVCCISGETYQRREKIFHNNNTIPPIFGSCRNSGQATPPPTQQPPLYHLPASAYVDSFYSQPRYRGRP